MKTPCLSIDLDKIEHNARSIVGLCGEHGIEVTGVTKGVCGHPEVAQAMLRGGVASLADSRLANIRRLRVAGIETEIMLLRLPALSAVADVVDAVDVSLNSEHAVLKALSTAALGRGRVHDVILMVDLGDLREGVWPDALDALVRQALQLESIHVAGLGTNLACFGGVAPDVDNMARLVALAGEIESSLGVTLERISGINSSALELIAAGAMPPRVNHARIGEAILLGRETLRRRPWPDTFQDAFVLYAEVLELQRKPSLPRGERCEDAFGRVPEFEDRGEILRALLNVGREDVDVAGVTPLDTRVAVLGGSSGYLVADVSAAQGDIRVGDALAFAVNYSALLTAMTSDCVRKRLLKDGAVVDAS
jgi:predicted amino acid racemase